MDICVFASRSVCILMIPAEANGLLQKQRRVTDKRRRGRYVAIEMSFVRLFVCFTSIVLSYKIGLILSLRCKALHTARAKVPNCAHCSAIKVDGESYNLFYLLRVKEEGSGGVYNASI